MKYHQKLCQRTKNLCKNGNCSVCDDVIKHATESHKQIDKKKSVKTVQVDMKKMIDVHEKLSKGVSIDPKDVNVLVLGGIINIISQHDALQDLENRIKVVEHNDLTNRTRIESLENWVVTQGEVIEELRGKLLQLDLNGVILKESKEVDNLKKKVASLDIDLKLVKNKSQKGTDQKEITGQNKETKSKPKACKECGKSFIKNHQLEKHLEDHAKVKNKKCDVCGKLFFLEWRLQKHLSVHTGEAKYCHFFNNQKDCPYQDIGCKFLHQQSGKCKFSRSCSNNLCQFEHAQEVSVEEVTMIENEDQIVETIDEYECHLCNQIHLSQDSLQDCCSHEECSYLECSNNLAVETNFKE